LVAELLVRKHVQGINKIVLFLSGCFAVCLIVFALTNYFLLFFDELTPVTHGAISALVLTLAVAIPLLLWVLYLQRKIGSHRREINHMASHDRLTGLPAAGAFSSMLDLRLNEGAADDETAGAFLIIRVTVPETAYSQYGFMANEEAISFVAAKIMSEVRSSDVVGRISPDMFAVFLSGATEQDARQIGSRMLQISSNIDVKTEARDSRFNVRVGGVSFDNKLSIEDMFHKASSLLTFSEAGEPLNFLHMSGQPTAAVAT
jgi:diguanylate cyclase